MANQMSKLAVGLGVLATSSAAVAADKPNILAIFGDDVGYWNISAYNQGMMGYETPNIDRIANEGALFTDHPTVSNLVLQVVQHSSQVKNRSVLACLQLVCQAQLTASLIGHRPLQTC